MKKTDLVRHFVSPSPPPAGDWARRLYPSLIHTALRYSVSGTLAATG